jgi:AP-2 complex subunit mu-1
MQGGSDTTFTAEATLSSTTNPKPWSRPPINVDFQVLMFTSSGLMVRFLKVFEKSNYQSVKWVRYLTKSSGTYQVRVSSFDIPKILRKRLNNGCASFETSVYCDTIPSKR